MNLLVIRGKLIYASLGTHLLKDEENRDSCQASLQLLTRLLFPIFKLILSLLLLPITKSFNSEVSPSVPLQGSTCMTHDGEKEKQEMKLSIKSYLLEC
jgi:hypothetical protein